MTLAFVLMLEALVNQQVESIEEFGIFEDVDHCIYFANVITRQGLSRSAAKLDYTVPYKAYCLPKWVDPETTEIFKR
tara:strand:- start:253 stop:483 length:231 start_codon:yes stop_codon:yes gene_type:complete